MGRLPCASPRYPTLDDSLDYRHADSDNSIVPIATGEQSRMLTDALTKLNDNDILSRDESRVAFQAKQ